MEHNIVRRRVVLRATAIDKTPTTNRHAMWAFLLSSTAMAGFIIPVFDGSGTSPDIENGVVSGTRGV